ncbi:lectin-like domain-containing protein [Levilactobacillus tujiorum]|uniref:WxL domain-containing protein n=1 Tax=Levilactobacillus tujiorum TaxID=2912243 RepID=A0ABX1L756_9LACO|nr:hypothetical protein [Levilactobacillus tujiorum]MCH5465214.1 hypothetical protein [Levilactobacillus tujiorum]NLR12229.1 hypothetical protein [Lactobacillus sp. HBUAS51387]NLR29807.1 hypothetical protein [Levilactobacillus tujiorum]
MKWWIAGIICGLSLLMMGAQARTVAAMTLDADGVNAVNTAPPGVSLDGMFTMGDGDNFTNIIDSKTVPKSIALITRDSTDPRDVQSGAVWSTATWSAQHSVPHEASRMDNRFNLMQDENISLWLYFGNKHAAAAEGMAFVFQNQGSDVVRSGYQSLGVWGNDRNYFNNTIAPSAIQKSWALEFDTHSNISTVAGAGDSFDLDDVVKNSMHIASGYPAEESSYTDHGKKYRSLNHIQPKPVADLADGQWHHLGLHWNVEHRTMSYVFNDRDPKTNEPRASMDIIADTIPINLDELEVSATQKYAYWGVTGSTGSGEASENGFVVVDGADSLGRIDAHAKLLDSHNREISAGATISPGEKITYQYTFDYDTNHSRSDVKPLNMTIPLPTQLRWLSGGVSYNNDPISEPFTKTELAQPEIKKTWQKNMNQDNSKVTVSVTGVAPEVSRKTLVSDTNSFFYGTSFQTKLPLPSYYIRGNVALKLENLGATTYQLAHNDTATIKGRLTNNGEVFTSDDLADYKLVAKIGDKPIPITDLAGTQVAGEPNGTFQLTVRPDQLVGGENTLVLQATDHDGQLTSNKVTIKLVRALGSVYFTQLPKDASFKATRLNGSALQIKRNKGWQLGVRDDRAVGQSWRVDVALERPFINSKNGAQLRGNLLFSQKNTRATNRSSVIVDANGVPVVPNHVTQAPDEETDIAGQWDDQSGPSLEVAGNAIAGDYAGQLVWKLIDAP